MEARGRGTKKRGHGEKKKKDAVLSPRNREPDPVVVYSTISRSLTHTIYTVACHDLLLLTALSFESLMFSLLSNLIL